MLFISPNPIKGYNQPLKVLVAGIGELIIEGRVTTVPIGVAEPTSYNDLLV